MKTILQYFYTIIHLRPIQIYYQIFYKIRSIFRKMIGFQYAQFIPAESIPIVLKPSISSNKSYFSSENRFCFLNQEQVFPISQINWNNEQTFGKLWAYNLNYFDFLNQEDISQSQGLALIRVYIYAYPTLKTGLEPYPTSLRGINWIKFLSKYQIQDAEIDAFLMAQYVRLADNLEYHLMGNHLLENAFSLLFGGVYFDNETFLNLAKKILKVELPEQILADGCHFERSVMYHQIVLLRMLDCLNLLQNNQGKKLTELENEIVFYAQKMVGFLQKITFKNGDIPLMGDAAKNIAPTTYQLLEYANTLNIRVEKNELLESNYRKFEEGNFELLVNLGTVSPDYLPAHSHCDIFNFVLYVDDKPFIVDTGISTYQNNERRHLERSTMAHNTVQIGDFEQSEIWGSFRVGRRAKVKILTDTENEIVASHDGFKRLGVFHQRSFRIENQRIIIKDTVLGKTDYPIKAYLHFHPDVELQIMNDKIITNVGEIYVENVTKIEQNDYHYSEEYNKLISAKMVVLYFTNSISTIIYSTKNHENIDSNLLFSA
ncbi:alginate lyase family protein [Arcicella sp. LKC2W]|uniref:alginate lyase family protein n=1 Tax=Arcicella sp. LKC2W TaxID=2984198 RepID=UPI002B21B03F|nr:alginate lyase family protein [Arcicella sp. LKC2W]MEA5461298.1 alginate lyase family protein [Arcicella sp. LKC2W]